MKKFRLVLLLLMVSLVFTTCACKPKKSNKLSIDNFESRAQKSVNDVTKVVSTTSVKDSNELVYEYVKTITFSDNGAKIKTDVTSLNSKFELQTTTNETTEKEYSKNTLYAFTFKKEYLTKVKVNENDISFEVNESNIKKVAPNFEVSVLGNTTFKLVYEKELMKSLTCTFTTSNNKTVVITCTYTY